MEHRKIVLQKQANRHRPDEGIYGDCHRTCIAMLLGMDRDDVPHFLHDDCGSEEFKRRVGDWLADRGLGEFYMIWNGDEDVQQIMDTIEVLNPGAPFILGGESRTGVNHSVVCQSGEMFDPSLTDAGIIAPTQPDGFYWVTFIVGFPDAR